MKVIVVGGGISGLAAAYTLQKKGVDAVVLEEKGVPGGRTVGGSQEGFVLDHGALFFMKCYNATYKLIDEMGLTGDLVPISYINALWVEGSLVPSNPLKGAGDLLRAPRAYFSKKRLGLDFYFQVAKLFRTVYSRRETLDFVDCSKAFDLDGRLFSDYVLEHSGKKALNYLFQPMIAGITLGHADEIGALYGAALFWHLLQGNRILKKGLHTLPERLYRKIESTVLLSTPAERIVVEHNTVKGVQTQKGFIDADAVICATTATAARGLIPNLPASVAGILEKVPYRACCHVVFAYDRPVIPEGFTSISFPRSAGATMAALADTARSSEGAAPPGTSLIHCYTYDRYAIEYNQMTDEDIRARLKAELKRYFPSMPENPIFSKIYRWQEAMYFATPGTFGSVHRLKKENGRPIEGLYFAGDYLNLASVEGAVKSGIDAADLI
ncbi:MAG: FAD-dependent oxidoreductase [Deltaproteobacteria bacterium]|nr:FAD-dependent oxidoreductase [Deltaproteobacteria bacterium]